MLNVATTRLILTHAETQGMMAAGGVVKSFGEFVAGDKIVVGLIIFIIIVVIQFVVITKGATRISEVAARFALDGMPGRQMAIDADLNAGIIDEREAQRRRLEITQQADFFGAMDGASKFVRGDAIAGIIITLINIIGGLVIGVVDYGMELSEAAALFTRLTIGDGLVSQVPAFLISLAAGLLVTRSSGDTNLPVQFITQLFSRPRALAITGAFRGDPGLHQPADAAAGGDRRRLHRPGGDADAQAARDRRRGPIANASRSHEETRGTGRGFPVGRSDGDRDRRGPDPTGRSRSAAAICWNASSACGKTWRPTSASSCPRCASATTCGSTRINIASRSSTCRWPREL